MNFDKIFVFTDFDLDGTVSLLELHWFLNAKPGQIKFKSTTVSNFRREYLSWLNDHKPTDYEKIYILDLDVSNNADLVDKENFKNSVVDTFGSYLQIRLESFSDQLEKLKETE